MNTSIAGVIAGLLLAIAITTGGWAGLFWGLVLGVIGYLVGAARDGNLDLNSLLSGRSRG